MSKSITEETVCFICRDSSQRTMILLSRYCTARGGAAMSYAKKVVIFLPCIFSHKEYLIR